MTYVRRNKYKKLEMAEVTISGTPSVGGYLTLTLVNDSFSSSMTGSGTTTLTLQEGYYFPRATVTVIRSTASDNFKFDLEVDGSVGGRSGQSGNYNSGRADYAEYPFKLTSTGQLRIKVAAIESSAPTITSNSKLWIWRTPL